LFAVEEKESGRFIGEAGLADFKRELGLRFDHLPEASWTIAPSVQGRGYATEAASAAIAWLEAKLRAKRSFCLIHTANAASLRVAEKLGYRAFRGLDYRGYPALLHERHSIRAGGAKRNAQ
jgi:RimJ/RimL family protein N-acetyltransferase